MKCVLLSFNKRNQINDIFINSEIDRIKKNERNKDSKRLSQYGYKIYFQNDEDGIIREIFSRIGVKNKFFVEFGIGDGLENNTLALLFEGWSGLWIEGSKKSVDKITKKMARTIQSGKLTVINEFITKDNIDNLISGNVNTKNEIDLLSVDIDGNDYHVFKAIKSIIPRVIVMEYNAKFGPYTEYCMDYDEAHQWKGNDCFGASLKFLEKNIDNYCLVGCNITGTNAFFVRKDLVQNYFLEPFTSENHYEPARYYLCGFPSGHPATYETIEKSLTMHCL